MANIRDVAKQAGETPMTVSRVINNSGYVKDETRQRIEAVIEELHYVPNMLSRGLRIKESMTIGLVISDISNPYWTKIIQGTESFASENGYQVILCNSSESEKKELAHLENLIKNQVDGILIAPITNSPKPIVFVQNQEIPIVVIGYPMPDVEVDVVRCDTNEAAYDIVKLLIALGHQRIAALTGPKQIVTATDRVDGYKRALNEAGIPIHDELIQYGHFSPEYGYKMAKEMLKLDPLPTAVITGNNFIAIGVTKALNEVGIRIPDDISVVTFDGPRRDLVIDPFFTMVSQPGYDLGEQAASILVQRLTKKTSSPFKEIILPTEILTYSSTAPYQTD